MAGCQAVPDRTQPVPRQAEGQPMGGYDRTQPVPRQAEGQPMGGYDRSQPVPRQAEGQPMGGYDRTQPVPRQAEGQPMGGYDRSQPVPRQAEGQPMGGYDRSQPVRSPPNPWNSTGTRSKCLIPKGFRQMDRIRVPVLFRTRNTRKRRQRLGLRVLFLTTIYIIYIYL
jgi:hypothetical protein